MPRHIFLLLLFLSLVITSCQPAPGEEVELIATVPPSPTQEIELTQTPDATPMARCTLISSQPDTGTAVDSRFHPVSDRDWVKGAPDAGLTIIEYSDFQCPPCQALALVMAQIYADHPDDIRHVFRHFPLISNFDKSALAAQAAEAAGIQGKFWEIHEKLYQQQDEWVSLSEDEFTGWLSELASGLGMDIDQFVADLNSSEIINLVQKAWDDGLENQLPGAPVLLINNQPYNGPIDYWNLSAVINLMLLKDRQFTSCPPFIIDPLKQYLATLHTEKGDILIELYPEIAPLTVNSFVFLAQNGWFDGVTFHRVIPGFVAQTGDPSGTGMGGPGYAFENEISPDFFFDKAGVLGMANSGADTNGSQFFITLGPAPHLNGGYTIFGQVLSGFDVVENLTPRNPQQRSDLPPGNLMLSVSIDER
jgi:cyclophilin family peptidyl-prolyl cis-trans isomerase/protein-disulfide isomerase